MPDLAPSRRDVTRLADLIPRYGRNAVSLDAGVGGMPFATPQPVFEPMLEVGGSADGSADGATDRVLFKIDTFTVSDPGTQTFTLTYEPMDDSLHVYWDGVEQEDFFTLDGQDVTLLDPSEVMESGDRVVAKYAYLDSGIEPDIVDPDDDPPPEPGVVEFIGATIIDEDSCASVVLPVGVQAGDLLVVTFSFFTFNGGDGPYFVDVTDLDARLTLVESFEKGGVDGRAFVAVGTFDGNTSPLAFTGAPAGDMIVAAYRGVSYSGSHGSAEDGVTPTVSSANNAIFCVMASGPFGGATVVAPTGYTTDRASGGGQAQVSVGTWTSESPTDSPSGTYGGGDALACCVILKVS